MTRLVFSFGVFSLFVGMVAIMLSKQSVDTSQDIRKQASTEEGPVEVTSKTSTGGSTFQVGDDVKIDLLVSTDGVDTAGIQTVFNIVTDSIGSDIKVEPHSDAGLISEINELQEVDDGFLVTNFSRPSLGKPFSAKNKVKFLTVSFTPEKPGKITINFDTEQSKSPKYGSNPPEEQLTHIAVMEFTVAGEVESTPTPVVKSSPTPNPVGGIATTCNIECSSNNDCGTNQRCYDTGSGKRCRLVTNVSSDSCAGLPDQGLSRSCNQYCADTNECADGLSCWYNQCRHEDNVENISCSPPAEAVTRLIQQECNASCLSNADCPLNMACLSNQCRLASNLSSATCTARTKETVSVIYTVPKGGEQVVTAPSQPTYQQYQQPIASVAPATSVPTLSPRSLTASPNLTRNNTNTATVSATDTADEFGSFFNLSNMTGESSALDAVLGALTEYSQQLGVDVMTLLRMIAIGFVALLIIWWLLSLLFGRRKERKISRSTMNGSTMMPPAGFVPPSLQTSGTVGAVPPKPTFSNPGLTAAPIAPYNPAPQSVPTPPPAVTSPQPGKVNTATPAKPEEKKSTMVSKLQAKGVETPK